MNWSVWDTHLLCSIYSHVWVCQSVTESCVHMCPPSLSTRNWDTPELTYTHPLTTRHCCTPVHSPYTRCTLTSVQWVSVLVLHSLRLNWCREQVNSLYLQLLSHSLCHLEPGPHCTVTVHCMYTSHISSPSDLSYTCLFSNSREWRQSDGFTWMNITRAESVNIYLENSTYCI